MRVRTVAVLSAMACFGVACSAGDEGETKYGARPDAGAGGSSGRGDGGTAGNGGGGGAAGDGGGGVGGTGGATADGGADGDASVDGSGGAPDASVDADAAPADGGSTGSEAGPLDDAGEDAGFGGPFDDLPASPVVETSSGTPANAPDLFGNGGAGAGSGPCVLEPASGSLFPSNWLRPRFRFKAMPGQNIFEIRLRTANQNNDLVVYTTQTSWTMPLAMWQGLAEHATDQPVSFSVRGASWNGAALSGLSAESSGEITIAPVEASGTVVYWTTTGVSMLKGFAVGDESVVSALAPSQVKMPAMGKQVGCIGCHTSTPDGQYAGFTAQDPGDNQYRVSSAIASLSAGSVGDAPPFLGAGGTAALSQYGIGMQTYSKGHWKAGDRIEIASFGKGSGARLAWFDLEATQSGAGSAFGYLARTGDPRGASAPAWSHSGDKIAYVSTNAIDFGRPTIGSADLYTVPYGDKQGGAATPVPGASDPNFNEFYPAYSADDALLAFNRTKNGSDMYNEKSAEVYVIPSIGGTALRLDANDPPACSGRTSPGVTNSWPKWSPEVLTANGKRYYWLIFSSTRGESQRPQLYVTGVVYAAGALTTHAALYLWNQPANESNHTPAWDVFKIAR